MTDLGLTHALQTNANVENEHANAAAGAASDGALHASENGASYTGSGAADASYSSEHASGSVAADASGSASGEGVAVTPSVDGAPELPELPTDLPVSAPDLPVETPDLPAELPELPVDTSAVEDASGSVDVSAAFEGMIDAMGELMAQFAGSLSAMLGF